VIIYNSNQQTVISPQKVFLIGITFGVLVLRLLIELTSEQYSNGIAVINMAYMQALTKS